MKNSNKKAQTKGFIKGILFSILVIATVVSMSAAQMTKNATLNYNNIKICIDGSYITPKDAAGNVVEPFIIDGTTYLPVRAVASALGKEVAWDGATSTVFLGKQPSSADGQGTRSDPYSASLGKTIEYNEYSFYATHQLQITCNQVIKGEAASILMAKTNGSNTVPNGSQEWIVFDMNLKHVSSTDGEDSIFEASDVIYKDYLFKPDGSKLSAADTGSFTKILGGYSAYDVDLYPGGSSRVILAVLTDKYDGDILLKIPYNGDKKNTWIKLNSDSNVITTQAELDKYLGTATPEAEKTVKITLKNSLPKTINNYGYSEKLEASFSITAFEYTSSGTSATITFSGEKTYDSNGAGQSRAVKIGWKLYDSEGYVVDDGTAYGSSISMGEKFKNCEDSIYSLTPGDYTLEIMNVN